MRSTALTLVLALLSTACPRSQAHEPTRPAQPDSAQDRAALVLPVTQAEAPRILAALERLDTRAQAGDMDAAWARAHYLLDLFDDARFRRDDQSLALLHAALGHQGEPERGTQATDEVVASLVREVDRVLSRDRLHKAAQAARTLLELDSRPPSSRVGLFSRMAALKAVARADGPLAPNARLRLFGYCRLALGDVARARYAERPRVLSHCLYPLFDADPEPYFADAPERRPPPPLWRDLAATLDKLMTGVAESKSRLALAGRHGKADLEAFVAAAESHMPALPDPIALALPRAAHVVPYDFTPLVILGAGERLEALADVQALTRAIQGDGRSALAVALSENAPAELVVRAAAAARAAGAQRLELGTSMEQTLRVPPNDYWAGRIQGDTITRMGVLALSLAVLEGPARVRTATWDPDRARLELSLEVTDQRWRILAPTGVLATIPLAAGGSPEAALRQVLAQVYAAFPDEDSLALVPGQGATVAMLVRAAQAARHDAEGRELMTRLGLARLVPRPAQDTLARRIQRRAGARVTIQPSALAARTSVVRRCYQDSLEARPGRGGTFRLELQQGNVVVTQGPRDKDLRQCVVDSLAGMIKAESMASAEVVLQPG